VYDLSGVEKAHYEVGLINNVDVRQGIYLNDSTRIDIAAGSNRTDNTITVMGIRPDGTLYEILASKIQSAFSEVYGFCLYHDLASRTVYAIVNNKEGLVEQWKLLSRDGQTLEGELSRTFRAGATQLEGCVGDDELGWLYIGEEDHGFRKFRAHPDSAANGILIDSVKSDYLKDDIEGITILYGLEGKGYLIVSSQGNNSYAVYRREGDNGYLGTFVIEDGETIDGVAETDGIDVLAQPLGPLFPQGIFVAQDGFNRDDGKAANQNFKAVRWEKIREKLSLTY
jgi:3-phytase